MAVLGSALGWGRIINDSSKSGRCSGAERAVEHTCRRLAAFGLSSTLDVGDAEHLRYPNTFFDLVYSWGVLHHSPDTPRGHR